MDKLAAELSQLYGVPRLHHVHRNTLHPVFLQLQVHQGHRQLRSVDMGRSLLEDVRRRADMVLMAVGEQVAADVVLLAQ